MIPARLAIFISGRGSNMQALVDAARSIEDYPARPILVVANSYDAPGLEWASENGLAIAAIDHRAYGKDREGFEKEIQAALETHDIDFIALAGFMRVLTPWFVDQWEGRMVNIHPSLLPKYPGLNTHARALEAGDADHGCTVHWVTAGVDEGAIIDQARIAIAPDDTPETLASRLLTEEHALYPKALRAAIEHWRTTS